MCIFYIYNLKMATDFKFELIRETSNYKFLATSILFTIKINHKWFMIYDELVTTFGIELEENQMM